MVRVPLPFFARAGNDAAETTFVALQPGHACLIDSRPLQSARGTPLCFLRRRSQEPSVPAGGILRRIPTLQETKRGRLDSYLSGMSPHFQQEFVSTRRQTQGRYNVPIVAQMESQIPPTPALQQTSTPTGNSPKGSLLKSVFNGSNGVRSGWRVLLFYSLLASLIYFLVMVIRAIRAFLGLPHQATNVLTPGRGLLNEAIFLFAVLFTSAIFARFERRSFADYGLPVRGAFGARFLEGLLWGLALMSCTLLVLRTTGNFYFGSLGLAPAKIPAFAVLWALFFAMVGVAEGFAFSGYSLFALTRGIGFWPAAAVLAVLFGGLHLLVNAGENWLGSVSLVIVGLLLALTLQRTGNLWFAIGMHAAWDWAQSFLYGVPDSGITVAGHVLNPSFQGSKWMTGGTAGPEGSAVTLLGYVFVFALINFRFPEARLKAGQYVKLGDRKGRCPTVG